MSSVSQRTRFNRAMLPEETLDLFRQGVGLSRLLEGYAVRQEQLQLAETISHCMVNQESLVCEAGTGTGKTFAYLVPALLSGKKIIISTGTKNLQDQLYYKDLPVICKAAQIPVKTALLKGRNNYLCKLRLLESEKDGALHNRDFLHGLSVIREWLTETASGDMSEMRNLPENSPVKYAVTSTAENCLGQDCEFFEDCYVLKARRKASEATLVVVNHHLLLADLSLRETGFGEVLPTADYIIFDEAHQLPELASEFFGETISSRQCIELINDSKVAIHNDAGDVTDITPILDNFQVLIQKFRLALGRSDQRIAWSSINEQPKILRSLKDVIDQLAKIEGSLDKLAVRSRSLENCWRRSGSILLQLKTWQERDNVEMIQWIETRGQGFLLHQTPMDISGVFQSRIAQHDCECIYTSATLAAGDDFNHFASQLGLLDTPSHKWASPYDFQNQTLMYLPQGLPDPADPRYTEDVVNISIPVIKASQGHTFLLFTSHRALQIAAGIIEQKIEYPVFVQGDVPRTELLEQFRATPNAVLLGTSSFWEGVDVKGQALSSVIIDKLPFAPPDDPVFQARAQRMQEQGMNPFMDYQLPQAIINLKQGAGRLIRDSQDYGVLTLCDPRLLTKSYGKKFLRSLPQMPITYEVETVREFFRKRETINV